MPKALPDSAEIIKICIKHGSSYLVVGKLIEANFTKKSASLSFEITIFDGKQGRNVWTKIFHAVSSAPSIVKRTVGFIGTRHLLYIGSIVLAVIAILIIIFIIIKKTKHGKVKKDVDLRIKIIRQIKGILVKLRDTRNRAYEANMKEFSGALANTIKELDLLSGKLESSDRIHLKDNKKDVLNMEKEMLMAMNDLTKQAETISVSTLNSSQEAALLANVEKLRVAVVEQLSKYAMR